MGYQIGNSAGLTLHTKGTGTSYQLNGVHALGATTLAVDTGANTLIAGDILTIANGTPADANKYVVNTTLSAGNLAIGGPGLRSAHVDNDAVTIGNNYTANVAFHRNAIHLITRAPAMPVDEAGNAIDAADDVMTVVDPVTGLAFQVALYRMYRRVRYEIGIAWGYKVVKSDFIATNLG
jgi:hypothetical protein